MKKYFCLAIIAVCMVACSDQKEKVDVIEFDSSTISEVDGGPKVKIKTGRHPLQVGDWVESCSGKGYCGPCFGVCVIIKWRKSNNSLAYSDGWREVNVSSDGTNLVLSFEEFAEIDNGNGVTTFVDEFNIGSEVSNLLGFNDITILAGEYPIV